MKLGFFKKGNIHTKSCFGDPLLQDSSYSGCPEKNSDNTVPCDTNCVKNTNVSIPSQDVGIKLPPQLAASKTSFSGNKNKTVHFDGECMPANIKDIFDNNFETCGGGFNVMDTAILHQEIYPKL